MLHQKSHFRNCGVGEPLCLYTNGAGSHKVESIQNDNSSGVSDRRGGQTVSKV